MHKYLIPSASVCALIACSGNGSSVSTTGSHDPGETLQSAAGITTSASGTTTRPDLPASYPKPRTVARVELAGGNVWEALEIAPGVLIQSEKGEVPNPPLTHNLQMQGADPVSVYKAISPGAPVPDELAEAWARAVQLGRQQVSGATPLASGSAPHRRVFSQPASGFGNGQTGGSAVDPGPDDANTSGCDATWFSQNFGGYNYSDFFFFQIDYYSGYANYEDNVYHLVVCTDTADTGVADVAYQYGFANGCGGCVGGSSYEMDVSWNHWNELTFPKMGSDPVCGQYEWCLNTNLYGVNGRYQAAGGFGQN